MSKLFCDIISVLIFFGTFLPFGNSFVGSGNSEFGHWDITRKAFFRTTADFFTLLAVNRTIEGVSPSQIFSSFYGEKIDISAYLTVVNTIVEANQKINEISAFEPTWHFDNEKIDASNHRLKTLRSRLYRLILEGDQSLARQVCGQILHILQDFYSHSNWIELGNKVPNHALGIAGQDIGKTAPADIATCTDCIPITGSTKLDCSKNINPTVTANKWLTSGYRHTDKPIGKCNHGGQGYAPTTAPLTGGINKDSRDSPHSSYHLEAAKMAQDATVSFLNGIRDSVGNDLFAQFLNIQTGKSLTIVMDTTGSMTDYIEAAKARCIQLIEASQNTSGSSSLIKNYVLVPFNDPLFGPALRTTNPEEFKREISALKAGTGATDGGDGPEMSLSGLLLAAQTSDEGSAIFVFTDYDPKDKNLADIVTSALQIREQTVYFFGPLSTAKGDVYRGIVERTGGKVLITDRSLESIFKTTAIMDDVVKGGSVILVTLHNMKDRKKTVNFHVDSSMKSVDVLVGHGNAAPTAVFTNNSSTTAPSVRQSGTRKALAYDLIIDTPTTKLYRFSSPSSGDWSVEFSAKTAGWFAEIKGQSYFRLLLHLKHREGSVQNSGETGEYAYRTMEGNPIVGTNLTLFLETTCDECVLTNATFLASNGSPIDTFSLVYVSRSNEYMADFIVPNESFFVKIFGKDELGLMFQRMLPSQITPSQLQLSFLNAPETVAGITPGSHDNLTFTITNQGANGSFELHVTDSANFVTNFEPKFFSMKQNEKITGNVAVTIPQSALPGTVSNLELSVSAKDDDSNSNFFRASFFVVAEVFDDIPPTCTVTNSTISENCENFQKKEICQAHYWVANLHLIDQGSGLGTILLRTEIGENSNVNWTTSPLVFENLKNESVSAKISGNCCLQRVQFSVIDQTGLSGTCVLTGPSSEDQTKLSTGAIVGIVIGVLAGLLIFAIIFFRMKKTRKNQKIKNQKITEISVVSKVH